jgi:hypothetical protein
MAEKDYFPLVPGLVLEYRSETADSRHDLRFEVLSVSGQTAKCRKTIREPSGEKTVELEVRRTAQGVYNRDFLEFPLPARAGAKWSEAPRSYEIETLSGEAVTPAGKFSGCLKVSYLIAGGDGGGGERFYAPGIGFVFESCSDELEPFNILLTKYSLPEKR